MAEYETYIRYFKEDVVDKEGEEIKLIIRDTEEFVQMPVKAKIYRDMSKAKDTIWILDPLGRPYWDKPAGLEIVKVEDEDELVNLEYHKAGIKV